VSYIVDPDFLKLMLLFFKLKKIKKINKKSQNGIRARPIVATLFGRCHSNTYSLRIAQEELRRRRTTCILLRPIESYSLTQPHQSISGTQDN